MSVLKAVVRRVYYAMPLRLRRLALRLAAAPYRGRIVIKDFGNYRAELHLDEIMEYGAFKGNFERDVVKNIETMTKPGMVILDIGANVGLHTMRFASLAGREGKVYAFEPTPYAFRKLRRNAELNPHLPIEPVQLALSNIAASDLEIDFRASWQHDGSRADEGLSQISFVRLDDWAKEHHIDQVDLVKIDIDGYEGLAFEGAKETLSRYKPDILIEASIYQYEAGRPDPFAFLADLGYTFEDMEGNALTADDVPARLGQLDQVYEVSFNLVAGVVSRK